MRAVRKASRLLTLACLIGVVAAVAAGSAAAGGTTVQSTVSGILTLCDGDQLSFTAKITLVYVSTTSPSGASVFLTHQNLGDMTAVDLTTGTAYHGSGDPGVEKETIIALPNGGVVAGTLWREVLEPAGGDGSPFIVTLLTHVVVGPDGTDRVSLTNPGGSGRSTACVP